MIASVKAYYNTGLTVGNCLDDIAKLDNLGFSSRTFDSIAIKQDRGRIDIRINTNYNNIKDADYVKINDIGYWVTGINMLNDNVAQVGLQQDFVTTIGIDNLDIISGWCTRRCVTDDELYKNTLDEPFAPTNPLVIDFGGEISGLGGSDGFTHVIVSSIDLTNLPSTAKAYLDDAKDKVLVPDLAVVPNSNTNTQYTSAISGTDKTCRLPATQAYVGNSDPILKALSSVRSLGVESCIVACYLAPAKWIAVNGTDGAITDMNDFHGDVNSQLTDIPGKFKNNKVYSGQFQRIINYSLATGDSSDNRIEDIVSPAGSLVWYVAADPRYNGHPVCMPKFVHGSPNNKLLSCISGAQWQNIPITYQGASGAGFLQNNIKTQSERMEAQRLYNILGSTSSMLGGFTPQNIYQTQGPNGGFGGFYDASNGFGDAGLALGQGMNPSGIAGNLLGGISSIGSMNANIMFSKQQMFNTYNQSMMSIDVQFPRIPSFQDYIGNSFYELRYRLSYNDMVRFDNFLTQFGYAVDEVLDINCFRGRTHFNYIQGRDIALKKSGIPQYLLEGMAKVIESGVRIWHTAPAHSKLLDNPIA